MTRAISERDAARVALREGRSVSGERPAVRSARDLEMERGHVERRGFSGSCQNTSLADWIQLIQMGRRDAVIVVRAPGRREARLWCKDGDVIDAAWDSLTGEDAVHQILSFDSGDVIVDFSTFERPRAIRTSTAGLLLEAAYRMGSRAAETGSTKSPEAVHSAVGTAPTSMAPTVTGTPSLPPAPGRAKSLRTLFWAAAAGMAAMAFCLSWRAGSSPPVTASSAPATTAAQAEDFPVHVDAQPDDAEIRLDGQIVATKALTTRLPRDGRLHEILVSARGYVPELVTFRDRSLSEQVALERLPPNAAEPPPGHFDDVISVGARRAQVTHHAPSSAQDAKSLPTPSPPSPASTTPIRARIQTIDDRQPRILPIDDGRPRIESVE